MQYAICEGLGIPQLEAASCGVPVFSVDYSAMNEVTTKLKTNKIPYVLFKELETGAFRAVPNDKDLVKQLFQYLELSEEEQKERQVNIRKEIIDNYSWDKTAERYEKLFDSIEPKNNWDTPMMFDSNNPTIPKDITSNREWITYAIKNIIMSPHLLKTTMIQSMIQHLDQGFVATGGNIVNYNRDMAKKVLENILNHKALLENLRSGKAKDESPFLKG